MRVVLCLITFSVLTFSCKKEKTSTEEFCPTPPSIVSFKKDIQPILNANCSTSGCHSGTNPKGGLNLVDSVSYMQLMDSKSGYIDTINPKESLLYNAIISTSNPMPPNGKMSVCKTDLILKWIEQKAKNN